MQRFRRVHARLCSVPFPVRHLLEPFDGLLRPPCGLVEGVVAVIDPVPAPEPARPSVVRYLALSVAALTKTDPFEALNGGGIVGLVAGASGAYADRLSRTARFLDQTRRSFRTVAKLVASSALTLPLLSSLGILVVRQPDCFGRERSSDEAAMSTIRLVFAGLAMSMSAGAVMYLRKT